MSLGKKMQVLRKARRMSQEKLAEQLHVSRQAVSKWEMNISMPGIQNVVQLSELFHVTTDYLLKDTLISEECNLVPSDKVDCHMNDTDKDKLNSYRRWLFVAAAVIVLQTLSLILMYFK